MKEKSTKEKRNRESLHDASIGMDLDVAALVGTLREPEGSRVGERSMVYGGDVDMDAVEFLDAAYG